jgi:hypothetical protein
MCRLQQILVSLSLSRIGPRLLWSKLEGVDDAEADFFLSKSSFTCFSNSIHLSAKTLPHVMHLMGIIILYWFLLKPSF